MALQWHKAALNHLTMIKGQFQLLEIVGVESISLARCQPIIEFNAEMSWIGEDGS